MMTYRFTDKPIKLDEKDLTKREARVLKVFRMANKEGLKRLTIADVARLAFKGQANAYFHAKNQFRRLVIARFIKKVARGTYALRERAA